MALLGRVPAWPLKCYLKMQFHLAFVAGFHALKKRSCKQQYN